MIKWRFAPNNSPNQLAASVRLLFYRRHNQRTNIDMPKDIIPNDFGLTADELAVAFVLDYEPMPRIPPKVAERLLAAQVAQRTEHGLIRGPRWNDL